MEDRITPDRASMHLSCRLLDRLAGNLADATEAGREMLEAFAGLMEPMWIDEYVHSRIVPIQRQHQVLGEMIARRQRG
jgi:hypothetical protein